MTRPDRNPVPPMKEFPVPINRKGLPVQPLWLLSVLSVLSAAALACGLAWGTGVVTVPATAVQAVAGTVCLILLFYLFRVLRTMRWTPILLLLISTGLLYTTGTLAAPAMLMALLCATGFSALLLAVADKATLTRLAFIPLAAYGLSLALCRDPMLSLAFGTRASAEREDGPGRVGVICLTSLCLGVTTLGIAALLLSRRIGSLSPAHLGALLDNLRTELSLRLVTLTQQLAEQIPQLSALTEKQALNIINSAINLFPGTAVMLCNLCAALMQVLLQGSLCAFGYADSVRGRVRLFRMSLMSSCVFLVAGILWMVTSLASSDSSLAGTVAQNIVIILHPGLSLAGILRILRNARRRQAGCFPIFLVLFIPCLLVYASTLLAVYEAISSILGAILARVRPPHGDGNDGDSDSDSGSDGDAGQGGDTPGNPFSDS